MQKLLTVIGLIGWLTVTGYSQEPAESPESILQSGTNVSRPLQSVTELPSVNVAKPADLIKLPATTVTPESPPQAEEILTRKGLPGSWSRYELLMWYPKAMPLPPLLTGSPAGVPPLLGNSQTSLLVGGRSIDNPMSTGGRFVWGSSGDEHQFGYEISYFFTGTRSATAVYNGANRGVILGRPTVDPTLGVESFVPVSTPTTPGQFRATSVNRMTGWEVNGAWNLGVGETCYLHFIGGYRYFLNHEGVRLEQTTTSPSPLGGGNTIWANAADQIDAHTRFHGGQVGFEFGQDFKRFFLEGSMKVAFGRSYEVVNIGGQTNIIMTGQPGPTLAPLQGGVFAQSSNTGRQAYSAFAVLPEGQFRLGYRFRDRSRFYVGYNVIYLSDAVRAGDQIDRTISNASVAAINGGFPAPAGSRPQATLTRTDFWAQGINLGFEWTY